jgi:type IV pilus assembly protein PilQ
MNARLSSLLVAGAVVLAGVQSGSLHAAALEAIATSPDLTLAGGVFRSAPDGDVLRLAIPGFQGSPHVQVFAHPGRVVVDLPGVHRGAALSRKEMKGLTSRYVVRWRLAQFSSDPLLTRVVLEVPAGTQAEVGTDADGVSIRLFAGHGAVQARLLPSAALSQPPVAILASQTPETVGVAAPAPRMADLPQIPAPALAAALPATEATAPAVPTPATTAPAVPTSVAAAAPEPSQAAVTPATRQAVATVAPTQPTAAPTAAPTAVPTTSQAAVTPATSQAAVTAATSQTAVTPATSQTAATATTSQPAVAPAAAQPAPMVQLPAATGSLQDLPALAVKTLTPAKAGLAQDTPLVSARKDDHRGGRVLGETPGRYTGARMTIDVVGTDLTSFLRIIADTAHLNLIVDSDVQGIYTFKFTDTPWDQVLDVILKHAGLGKEVSNGIIRVAKVEKLQKEEEDRKRLDDAKALSGDTQSITRPLSFAKASEAKNILDKMLTKRGSLIVDDRTNTLIITDLPRNLPLIDDLIAQLDVQIQQVQIEARVVEATKNWEQAFGVQWPTANSGSATLTTGSSSTAAPWGSTNGASWNSVSGTSSNNTVTGAFSGGTVGVTDIASPAGQLWLSFLSNRMSINVILQALETQGVVKVVSSPKVVTQNNKKAKVLSGQKIPYPTTQSGSSSGAITVAFADANLSLEVTPQITNDGTILMDIHVEKSDANFSQEVSGTPTITTKLIETQVLVKDGGTAVMGGVYKNTNSSSTTGVPFLSHLPLIGFLFRNKTDEDQNDELLVFITPHILKN